MKLNRKKVDAILDIAAGFTRPGMSIILVCNLTRIYYEQGRDAFIRSGRFIGWQDTWLMALLYHIEASQAQMVIGKEIEINL